MAFVILFFMALWVIWSVFMIIDRDDIDREIIRSGGKPLPSIHSMIWKSIRKLMNRYVR